MKHFFRLSIIVLVGLIVSCGHPKKPGVKEYTDTPTTGEATVGVDETFQPLIEAELPVFHNDYKYAKVTPKYLPEVDAFNLLLKDSLRLVVVSRPLSKDEMDYFHAKRFFPRELKIAVDGIAVLVHPSNRDTLLTVNQLKKIFLGEINTWNQVNPKSGLGKIKVIFDNPNSSTVRFIVDSITTTGKLGKDLTSMLTNTEVVEFVAKTPNAIGLIGVSWVSDRDDPSCLTFLKKIKVASISKEDKAVAENSFKPYKAYLALGNYPLTRNIYVINTEPRSGLVSGFASFVASDKGQRIIQKTGVLPATQPVRLIQVRKNL